MPGYEIFEEIGRGGMGVVFRARQSWPRRIVALKVVRLDSRPERLARFRTEVTAAARFIHPNVISIYEVRDHLGDPYFSMEYALGGNLAQRLAGGPLPPRQAAELLLTLARAVQFGHACGVVHPISSRAISFAAVDGNEHATNRSTETEPASSRFAGDVAGLPGADFGLANAWMSMGKLTGG